MSVPAAAPPACELCDGAPVRVQCDCGSRCMCAGCLDSLSSSNERPSCPVCGCPTSQHTLVTEDSSASTEGGDQGTSAAARAWEAEHGKGVFQRSVAGGEWLMFTAPCGRPYYVNTRSNEHTWSAPVDAALATQAAGVAVDDEYEEGLGDDFESSGPWKPPSMALAAAYLKKHVFAGGTASLLRTTNADLAACGVGIPPFFTVMHTFALVCGVYAVAAVPLLWLAATGARVPARLPDPLGFAHLSLGNVGPVSADVAAAQQNALLSLRANNATAGVMETLASFTATTTAFATIATLRVDGDTAAAVVGYTDLVATVIALLIAFVASARMRRTAALADAASVSLADFSVLVCGLPSDASREEIASHFSALFALDGTGITASGDPRHVLLPRNLQQDVELRARNSRQAMAAAQAVLRDASAGALHTAPAAKLFVASRRRMSIPSASNAASHAARDAVQRREQQGVVTSADSPFHFPRRLVSAAPCPARAPQYALEFEYEEGCGDGWVADVTVVRRDIAALRVDARRTKLHAALRVARARVKMHSRGTLLPRGESLALRKRAMDDVNALEVELSRIRQKAAQRLTAIDASQCVGAALVTFVNEESMQRCLDAYRGSELGVVRWLQQAHLRFRDSKAPGAYPPHCSDARHRGHALRVVRAPDPRDIQFENLSVSDGARTMRQAISRLLTLLLLCVGFVAIVVAQSQSQAFSDAAPDLTVCETELPALFMGGYENVTAARDALQQGYGTILRSRGNVNGSSAGPAASGSSMQLSRMAAGPDRSAGDMTCGTVGAGVSLAYRYDFTGIPTGRRNCSLSSLFAARVASISSDGSPPQPVDVSSRYYVGTAVPYGQVGIACDAAQAAQEYARLPAATAALVPAMHVACPDPRRVSGNGFCQCTPASVPTSVQCRTLACFSPSVSARNPLATCKGFALNSVLGCYCSNTLTAAITELGAARGLQQFATQEADACSRFLQAFFSLQGAIVGAAVASSVVNTVMWMAVPMLVAWEAHVSVTEASRARVIRSTVIQLFNSAVTVLVVNAAFPRGVTPPPLLGALKLFAGQHSDFTTEWYAGVGNTLTLTLIINIVFHVMISWAAYVSTKLTQCGAARLGVHATQSSLNALYVRDGIFDTSVTYPTLLVQMLMTLLYGTGMPIIYIISLVGILAVSLTDRFLLLRLARKPKGEGDIMAQTAMNVLHLGILVHLAVGCWMRSGGSILPSAVVVDTISSLLPSSASATAVASSSLAALAAAYDPTGASFRILRKDVLPSFLLLLILVITAIASLLTIKLWRLLRSVVLVLTCGCVCCVQRTRGSKIAPLAATRRTLSRQVSASEAEAPPAEDDVSRESVPVHAFENIATTSLLQLARSPVVERGILLEASARSWIRKRWYKRASVDATPVWLRDTGSTGGGKGVSPLTAPFSRIHDPSVVGTVLSQLQVDSGWRLQCLKGVDMLDIFAPSAQAQWMTLRGDAELSSQDAAMVSTTPVPRRRFVGALRRFMDDSRLWILRHFTKHPQDASFHACSTWQVIAEHGLPSYELQRHPRYATVMAFLRADACSAVTGPNVQRAMHADAVEMQFGMGRRRDAAQAV